MKTARLRTAAFRLWASLSGAAFLYRLTVIGNYNWDARERGYLLLAEELMIFAIMSAAIWIGTVGLAWVVSAFIEDERPTFFDD
jgi:hypothetical protein